MSVGTVFYIIALVFFFLAGVGSSVVGNPMPWGFVCLTLGLMLSGISIPMYTARPQ